MIVYDLKTNFIGSNSIQNTLELQLELVTISPESLLVFVTIQICINISLFHLNHSLFSFLIC